MPFWSRWSRKQAVDEQIPIEPERTSSFTDADREYVRTALDRFEESGLRIWPELNRDLLVVRALIDSDSWKQNGGPPTDRLLTLFLALAAETDSLAFDVDNVEVQFVSLSTMDEDAAEDMLQAHSNSIFMNARSIDTVIEDDTGLQNMVHALSSLNDLEVTEVSGHIMKNGFTRVSFQIRGLGECFFEIKTHKRPDVTPALVEMNRIAKRKGLGQYVMVSDGSSESMTFIFAPEADLLKIVNLLRIPEFVSPAGVASA